MGPWSYVSARLACALRELTPEGFGVPQDGQDGDDMVTTCELRVI